MSIETTATTKSTYCRWSAEENLILERALTDENIHTLTEVCRLVSDVTGRTEGAVAARTYYAFKELLEANFNTRSEEREEVAVHVSKQITFDLVEAKEELEQETLDSRTIFDLYEKLAAFKEVVQNLRDENATLRKYHDLSEVEIARLRSELNNTNQEKNKTIEHIKSIQSMITSLSGSAFGTEPKKQEVAV